MNKALLKVALAMPAEVAQKPTATMGMTQMDYCIHRATGAPLAIVTRVRADWKDFKLMRGLAHKRRLVKVLEEVLA